MRKFLLPLALIGALFAGQASAGQFTVTWVMPTLNTDGSTIPATGPGSLVSTTVEYGTCNGALFGVKAGEKVINTPTLTATFLNIAPGTYCVQAKVTNTYVANSAYSTAASKVIPVPVPNPPTQVVVQ